MRILIYAVAISILCGFNAGPVLASDCSSVADQIAINKNNPKELRKLLAKDPQCGRIWEVLGDYYYARGIWNESKDCYEEALKLSPGKNEIVARLREIRPKTTAIIKDDNEMLSYRRSIAGTAPLSAGTPSSVTAPSSGNAEKESMKIASAPVDKSAVYNKPARQKAKPGKRTESPKAEKVGLMINFDYNSSNLTPESEKLLSSFAEMLNKEMAGRRFLVQGHTDNIGEHQYNKQLSVARAQSVKTYLSGSGIDPARLEVQGFGADKPIYDNETEQGRSKNRRVEFQEK